MPKAEYKQLNIRTEDYEFFEEFTQKLSAQMGIELKMQQALRMAVTQYESNHNGADERKVGDD